MDFTFKSPYLFESMKAWKPAMAAHDEAALKTFCLQNGPAYAHPRRIFFDETLPLNGAGKIDRGAVQARLSALYGAGAGGAYRW